MRTPTFVVCSVLLAACSGSRPAADGPDRHAAAPDAPAVPESPAAVEEAVAPAAPDAGGLAPDPSPDPAAPRLDVRACSWGGVGPQAASDASDVVDAWFVLVIEATSAVAVESFALSAVELLDDGGSVRARGVAPFDLRVVPPDRSALDLSAFDTRPFDGTLAPQEPRVLRIHGALDARRASVGSPTGFRAEFRLGSGGRFELRGPVDPPWPTAGPAALPR